MRVRACLAAVIVLLASLVTPANAELFNPRQDWLRASTAGLFLHWGMFTAPRHTDCAAWEHDVSAGGWTPDYWIDEATKLGASYVVLTTFHSRLGYARPWPSKIPGSCSTQRDFLGELIAAGQAKGVRVMLYMTDDPQWHNETGHESLDSAAYSAYKGHPVDLTTRPGFGEFSYDLFDEVMDRYSDLAGFWIDNDNEYWEQHGLYEHIREKRPSWLLSNNNEDTPIMDTVSNEQKTGMTPSYDYPQAIYTPMPRLTEADYKLPTNGDWWYSGGDQAVDVRLSTGRYITNAGSSIKSLMAETAMLNGKFPPQQEAFNTFMASWTQPIRKTLEGTVGGGYMYGGLQPGFWNDGAHGVITMKGATQYVHVVTRPSTNLVRLRDNGYRVTGVSDVRTGKPMEFAQSGGYLSILDIKDWDTYDTVFEVHTAGQQYFYDKSTIKATASASAPGHPASNLVDGSYLNYWDAGGQQPVSVTLDLGKKRSTAYLAVHERESSPTAARESFGRAEDSARIKDYRVYASDDGKNWGTPVRTGALPSTRGVQFVDVGEVHARYLKLEVLNTWSGPQAKPFFHQLALDEIDVAYGYPDPHGELPLEAESPRNGFEGKASPVWCEACSGTAAVTGLDRGAVTFRGVQAAGPSRLQLDTTGPGTLAVSVNGAAPITVTAPAAIAAPLKAGANTIKMSGNVGLDRIAVAPLPPESSTPRTTLTVEPAGVQWVSPGQQSLKVTASLRLDVDDPVDQVSLAPVVPAGWTLQGAPVTAAHLGLGQVLSGSWTVTAPAAQDVTIPVTASFTTLGRAKSVSKPVQVKPRPADRVFMREAEDSANDIGDAGVTSCSPCSGGQKVRNIGGSAGAAVTFPGVTVAAAGQYPLYLDFTVNGDRSYFVSVNGGTPVEVKVSGAGNSTPYTTSVPVTLNAGANTIRIGNDRSGAPDLDRISLG
ncbi:alpha-L-fucosidase [Amycolatopsis sp. NBRC 101858]|uniref:alpha-L-fucosidase n=1 Tax=Amycolatopsis sp. NBRC 101858 TaxID=3032200 RepID=UPI0024A45455|nr:alpha-L-fucosidase [Amycolatopsis sp. NBRC 101858]GLY35625.1 alpha-L-fucosidase [Amycolatopsis sp. NBRC 101858]